MGFAFGGEPKTGSIPLLSAVAGRDLKARLSVQEDSRAATITIINDLLFIPLLYLKGF